MNLQETDALSALRQIGTIVANSSDMIEVFRLARRYLAEIIPYDTLAILVDDRDRECLTAPLAFNDRYSPDNGELVITYENSLISEVLITRKSRSRFSLDDGEGLVNFDIRCDLLVPMCTPDTVVGCLYFARNSEVPFDMTEQANAEQAASMLAVVLERAKNNEEFQAIRDSSNRWQEHYLILLEALPYAAIVVDLVSTAVREFNQAFEQLLGYTAEELHAIKFSDMFPQIRLEEHPPIEQFLLQNGQIISLVHKNGSRVQVQLGIGSVPIGGAERCLLVFQPVVHQSTESFRDLDVVFFLLSCLQPCSSGDLLEALREPLDRLAVIWGAKYVSLVGHQRNGALRALTAFRLSEGIKKELQEPLLSSLGEEPFLTILQSQQPTFIGDIKIDTDFQQYRAVAARLGYTSFASLPLMIKEEPFGLLNLFFEKSRVWTEVEKEALTSAARAILAVIVNNREHTETKTRAEHAEVCLKLATLLKAESRLDNIIVVAAKETSYQLNFDLFSVTLFNQDTEGLGVFCLGNKELEKTLHTDWHWEKINGVELGRLLPNSTHADSPDSLNSKRYEALISAIYEKVSVLLLSKDNYLGNLTLGRLGKDAFQSGDIKFIRQVALLMAEAIESADAQHYQKVVDIAKKKDDFVYTISHELKAPLASVKSLATFLLDDYKEVLNDDGLRYLSRIQSNLEYMENLILNLLDFSRLGGVSRSFSLVSAADIIDRALVSLSGQIEQSNISVEVTANLPVIYCDPTAMTQVFINLISNAIKHTRDDTSNPFIEIEYHDGETFEEFVVRDNGVGIAEEYHDKIFNLFYTVADEANAKSSGVGLAIVKKIVGNHGGRIWVNSSLGKGAEFHFTITKKGSENE